MRDAISYMTAESSVTVTAIDTRTRYLGLTKVHSDLSATIRDSRMYRGLLRYTRRAKKLENVKHVRQAAYSGVRLTHSCAVNIGNAWIANDPVSIHRVLPKVDHCTPLRDERPWKAGFQVSVDWGVRSGTTYPKRPVVMQGEHV